MALWAIPQTGYSVRFLKIDVFWTVLVMKTRVVAFTAPVPNTLSVICVTLAFTALVRNTLSVICVTLAFTALVRNTLSVICVTLAFTALVRNTLSVICVTLAFTALVRNTLSVICVTLAFTALVRNTLSVICVTLAFTALVSNTLSVICVTLAFTARYVNLWLVYKWNCIRRKQLNCNGLVTSASNVLGRQPSTHSWSCRCPPSSCCVCRGQTTVENCIGGHVNVLPDYKKTWP